MHQEPGQELPPHSRGPSVRDLSPFFLSNSFSVEFALLFSHFSYLSYCSPLGLIMRLTLCRSSSSSSSRPLFLTRSLPPFSLSLSPSSSLSFLSPSLSLCDVCVCVRVRVPFLYALLSFFPQRLFISLSWQSLSVTSFHPFANWAVALDLTYSSFHTLLTCCRDSRPCLDVSSLFSLSAHVIRCVPLLGSLYVIFFFTTYPFLLFSLRRAVVLSLSLSSGLSSVLFFCSLRCSLILHC